MPNQVFNWSSYKCLPCVGCYPAEVVICLKTDVVKDVVCALGTGSSKTTIDAQLINVLQQKCPTGVNVYSYSFRYDDAQLIAGARVLVGSDVSGVFCKGCLTDWIEELVGNDVTFTRVGTLVTVTNQHGCQFQFSDGGAGVIIVSGNAGNIISAGTDGGAYLAAPTVASVCPSVFFIGAPV